MPQVTHIADIPTVFLVEHDVDLRAASAYGLRFDGMNVIEFATSTEALAAVAEDGRPAVLVIAPEGDGAAACDLARQVRAWSPQTQVVFTPGPRGEPRTPPGVHVLAKPFEPCRLSRFIRLVVAKPALRSTLQALYRRARSTTAGSVL